MQRPAIRDVAVLVETNVTAAKSNLHVGASSAMLVVHSGDWSLSADTRFKSPDLARLCFSLALGIVSLSNFACADAALKRRKVGSTILSWSILWNAELVIGCSDCHLAMIGDQNTCGERQEDS